MSASAGRAAGRGLERRADGVIPAELSEDEREQARPDQDDEDHGRDLRS